MLSPLLGIRDRFAYPFGFKPQLNYNHPLGPRCTGAGVFTGSPGQCIELVGLKVQPTITGTWAGGVDAFLGPFSKNLAYTYTGIVPTTTYPRFTFAVIFRNDSIAADSGPDVGQSNNQLYYSSGFTSLTHWGGVSATNLNTAISAGFVYFIIYANDGGGVSYTITRQVQGSPAGFGFVAPRITTGVSASPSTATNDILVGRTTGGASISAWAVSLGYYLPLASASAWMSNPWSLWFADYDTEVVGSAITPPPAGASGRRLTLLGAG